MDKKEFSLFAMALRTYYSKENLLPNEQAMQLWYSALADIPYELAETMLKKWVATNKWSPSIAEIREAVIEIGKGEQPEWGEAWKAALDAIRRFGLGRKDEALNSMDELTRKTVERIGYRDLCLSQEGDSAIRGQFRMIFETVAKREKEAKQLPPALRETIAQIQAGNMMALESGEKKE